MNQKNTSSGSVQRLRKTAVPQVFQLLAPGVWRRSMYDTMKGSRRGWPRSSATRGSGIRAIFLKPSSPATAERTTSPKESVCLMEKATGPIPTYHPMENWKCSVCVLTGTMVRNTFELQISWPALARQASNPANELPSSVRQTRLKESASDALRSSVYPLG